MKRKKIQINSKKQKKNKNESLFVVELELCLSHKIKEPMSFNTQHILEEANVPKQTNNKCIKKMQYFYL